MLLSRAPFLRWGVPSKTMLGLNCLQTFGFGFSNGGADATVLPNARLDSFLSAGIDFVRMAIDPAKLCADDSASNVTTTQLDADIASVITGIQRRTSRGLKVLVDMHVIGGGSVAGWGQTDFIDGTGGTKFTRLVFVAARLAKSISANCRPSDVAFELFNEPAAKSVYTGGGGASYPTQILSFFNSVRAVMPLHTIVVEGTSDGSVDGFESGDSGDGLINLTPSQFDANTAFAWHPYEPPIVAAATAAFYADDQGIIFPPNASAWDATAQASIAAIIAGGGTTAAKLTAIAAVSTTSAILSSFVTKTIADGGLSQAQQLSNLQQFITTNFSFSFPSYYGVSPAAGAKQDAAWIATRYAVATAWADAASVNRRRLFVTEFGIPTTINSSDGSPDPSVVAFLQAHRDAAVNAGIGCLNVHEIQGSNYQATVSASPWGLTADTKSGLRL